MRPEFIATAEVSAFIDEHLRVAEAAPAMYGGTLLGVEMRLSGLMDILTRFVVGFADGRRLYREFRKEHLPKCPSPMLVSQWFSDEKYGDPGIKDVPEAEREHWAGMMIVRHYAAYKKYLETREV